MASSQVRNVLFQQARQANPAGWSGRTPKTGIVIDAMALNTGTRRPSPQRPNTPKAA
jgi:hypothetical protein